MEIPKYINICITVLEANDLPHSNISSLTCIEVGSVQKCTNVVNNTANPFYNEYFVFEFHMKFSTLMTTCITFKVFEAGKLVKRLIGSIAMEAATVWGQTDHRLKTWLPITIPSDKFGQVRGNLNCEIFITVSGVLSYLPKISSWIIPEVFKGRRARYMVRVYECVGLEMKDKRHLSEVSVQISFARKTGSTTTRLQDETVVWNEQITFIELYPPLFQKITVHLLIGKKMISSKSIYLVDISRNSDKGYLPRFGPSYIHLYVNEYVYCASILLAIVVEYATLLKTQELLSRVTTLPLKPLTMDQYGKKTTFLCYGVLFDAVIMDAVLAQPHFSINMSLGFGRLTTKETEEYDNVISSPKYRAQLGNSDFVYLPIYEDKPCMFAHTEWPNTHFRLTNSNIIAKVSSILTSGVNDAHDLIIKGCDNEARQILQKCFKQCKIAKNIITRQKLIGINSLDIERVKELSNILKTISSVKVRDYNLEDLLLKCNSLINMLNPLCEDIQESLPSVLITFKRGNTALAYCKLHPRQIFFSGTELKIGNNCGRINAFHLLDLNQVIIGRVDIWLWLGFKDQVSSCLKLLPPGHQDITTNVLLPRTLTYTNDEMYTAICYIFGGLVNRINSPGLCNPSVKVMFCNQIRETYDIVRTLAPLWQETITFADVHLYPSPEYIKYNPPVLTLELWDHSTTIPTLIGSTFVIPQVRLQPISLNLEYELLWFKLNSTSQILAVFEVIQLSNQPTLFDQLKNKRMSYVLPQFIEPPTVSYRIEAVFWGIRPVSLEKMTGITGLQATIQWGTAEIQSHVVGRFHKSPNFKHNLEIVEIEIPDIKSYIPPVVLHIRSPAEYAGFDMDYNVYKYINDLPSKVQWQGLTFQRNSLVDRARARRATAIAKMPDVIPLMEINNSRWSYEIERPIHKFIRMLLYGCIKCKLLIQMCYYINPFTKGILNTSGEDLLEVNDDDWWCKYESNIVKYKNELENQPEFDGFNDTFKTFAIKQQKRAKRTTTAKLKIMVCIYQWPDSEPKVTLQGQDPEPGLLKQTILNDQVNVLVRVYCVKAYNLHPCDRNGKSDPYIEIRTPSNVVSDKSNYISRQLNPVFGKYYEIIATFPFDSVLAVRIMDWDIVTSNDVIGETFIDIENRFYSKFRATCALPSAYSSTGWDKWRDIENPTTILEQLCNKYNIPLPEYLEKSVIIGPKEFVIDHKCEDEDDNQQKLALLVLRNWSEIPIIGHVLVPEHIELRSLFHQDRPGIERGKLEMWVDLFDMSLGPVPPPVDISPRKPEQYELRVIIWNTCNIPLVDDSYFVGKKHTDIYVKGWLGDQASTQSTDVHYTSINGVGNFNWRFIFPFQFIRNENKMVILKNNLLEVGESELKVPPLLYLQVWDSDRVSADDYIGTMVLNLNSIPLGTHTKTTWDIIKYIRPDIYIDIFKTKRVRGWWPFLQHGEGKAPSNAGFLEAEIQLLTNDEALANPAGLGRAPPAALPPPVRPEVQIKFWFAPLRILSHYIFGVHKGKLILFILFVSLIIFVFVGFYSVPVFFVKKVFGV